MPAQKKSLRTAVTAGYLALAAVDSLLAGRRSPTARRARHVTKPLLMPTLTATTHLAADGRADRLVRSVEVAQAFSWGGDVALIGRGRRSFLTGVGSFALAHVAYISGFWSARDEQAGLGAPGVRAAAAQWAVMAPVMAVQAGRKDPALRVPVAAYAGVLSGMFATSTLLRRSMPAEPRRRILAGTSLFLLSDSLLGVQKFMRHDPSPALETAVMATYTTGQWLIAEGAVAAARSD